MLLVASVFLYASDVTPLLQVYDRACYIDYSKVPIEFLH